MEGKRRSVELQYSLLQNEHSRLVENITGCLTSISRLVQTCSRRQLQALSRLNGELLQKVTAAADDTERLAHQYDLVLTMDLPDDPPPAGPPGRPEQRRGEEPRDEEYADSMPPLEEPGGGWHQLSSAPPPADGAGEPRRGPASVPGSGTSFHSAAGQQGGSVASGTSSQRLSPTEKLARRADKNVALRKLMRPAEEEIRPQQDPAPPPLSAASEPRVLELPVRVVDMTRIHEVKLAHREELEDGTHQLFLNLQEDEASLETLCKDLERLSKDESYMLHEPPRPGDLVFAHWDGTWYRAKVDNVSDSELGPVVGVLFVDYGNYDTAPLDQCRRLPDMLARMPVCAIQCTLYNSEVAPAGPLRELQAAILDLARDHTLQAQFHPSPAVASPALRVELALEMAVEGRDWQQTDLGCTLANVLAVAEDDARRQLETGHLDLRSVLAPWERRRTATREDRVLSWLSAAGDRASTPPPDDGLLVKASPVKERRQPESYLDPPMYREQGVVWDSRPLYQSTWQLCARRLHRDVTVVNAQTPERFSLCFQTDEEFQRFQSKLADAYSRLPAHPRVGLESHLLRVGSYWAARIEGDWYRVVIREVIQPRGGDGLPTYRVHCVDFDDEEEVPAADMRPMLERFAAQHVYIVPATCVGVAPLGAARVYSEPARERFIELVDAARVNAHTVEKETTDDCLAVVLYVAHGPQFAAVTQLLAAEGLVFSWQVQDDAIGSREAAAPHAEPTPVPLAAAAAAAYDDEDWEPAGAAAALPEPASGAVPRRPPEHPAALAPGALVYVRVTAVASPALFYVVLPFGAEPASAVNADFGGHVKRLEESQESVEALAATMRRFYSWGPDRGAFSPRHQPTVGSLVAARWEGGWHRGRLQSIDDDVAEVYLLDWGHTEPVPTEELRDLMPLFRRPPPHAVSCSLDVAGRPPPLPADALPRLVTLAQRGLLLAEVHAAPPAGPLLVDLVHAESDGQPAVRASRLVCAEG